MVPKWMVPRTWKLTPPAKNLRKSTRLVTMSISLRSPKHDDLNTCVFRLPSVLDDSLHLLVCVRGYQMMTSWKNQQTILWCSWLGWTPHMKCVSHGIEARKSWKHIKKKKANPTNDNEIMQNTNKHKQTQTQLRLRVQSLPLKRTCRITERRASETKKCLA